MAQNQPKINDFCVSLGKTCSQPTKFLLPAWAAKTPQYAHILHLIPYLEIILHPHNNSL